MKRAFYAILLIAFLCYCATLLASPPPPPPPVQPPILAAVVHNQAVTGGASVFATNLSPSDTAYPVTFFDIEVAIPTGAASASVFEVVDYDSNGLNPVDGNLQTSTAIAIGERAAWTVACVSTMSFNVEFDTTTTATVKVVERKTP